MRLIVSTLLNIQNVKLKRMSLPLSFMSHDSQQSFRFEVSGVSNFETQVFFFLFCSPSERKLTLYDKCYKIEFVWILLKASFIWVSLQRDLACEGQHVGSSTGEKEFGRESQPISRRERCAVLLGDGGCDLSVSPLSGVAYDSLSQITFSIIMLWNFLFHQMIDLEVFCLSSCFFVLQDDFLFTMGVEVMIEKIRLITFH